MLSNVQLERARLQKCARLAIGVLGLRQRKHLKSPYAGNRMFSNSPPAYVAATVTCDSDIWTFVANVIKLPYQVSKSF